jgi:hypothetical protein
LLHGLENVTKLLGLIHNLFTALLAIRPERVERKSEAQVRQGK